MTTQSDTERQANKVVSRLAPSGWTLDGQLLTMYFKHLQEPSTAELMEVLPEGSDFIDAEQRYETGLWRLEVRLP